MKSLVLREEQTERFLDLYVQGLLADPLFFPNSHSNPLNPICPSVSPQIIVINLFFQYVAY